MNNNTHFGYIFGAYGWSANGGNVPKSLKYVNILEGVSAITDEAFNSCRGIEKVILPKSISSIGEYVFDGCDNLTEICYVGSSDEWNSISISANNYKLSNVTITYDYK